jgi:hypothetical protein
MALTRLLGGWIAVVVWLLLWELVASGWSRARGDGKPRARARVYAGEALLLTLLGALWFASLGSGGWWLVFGLVGALREYPPARARRGPERPAGPTIGGALLGVLRTVVAGGLLAWRLGPA